VIIDQAALSRGPQAIVSFEPYSSLMPALLMMGTTRAEKSAM
jgi:hypothetical protein